MIHYKKIMTDNCITNRNDIQIDLNSNEDPSQSKTINKGTKADDMETSPNKVSS